MGLVNAAKKLFYMFVWMPIKKNHADKIFLHTLTKTHNFELWAFGRIYSHTFGPRERERLWNQRHGKEYFFIEDNDYFQQHMEEIVELWKKAVNRSDADEV